MNKEKEMLIPQYMHKFKCIGSNCEDSCCIGWTVSIDKKTYTKYRKCKDKELKELFDKNVKRNRSNNSSEYNYAKIKMNDDISCPFLTEEKLCKVHSGLGEENLSVTCTTYPRMTNSVNGVLEKSATMSCPEVVRLALLNPEPMEFDYIEVDENEKNKIGNNLNTHEIFGTNKLEKYFWELRIFTIELLQNRNYKLWERLIILGMFYEKLDKYTKQGKTNETLNLIASYTRNIEQEIFHEYLNEIPSYKTVQMVILKELVDEKVLEGVTNQRYLQCFVEFMKGIQCTDEATKEEMCQHYEKAYSEYYKPYMEKHEYILENYLVNYVFKNLFPIKGEKEIFDSYMMLVVHYSMIKMHLIGISAVHKEKFSTEHIVKLIQSFAKVVEHNNVFLKYMHDILKRNEIANMAYMAILIKN